MTQTNKEYATALFSLATENNALDEYKKALGEIREIFMENPDYARLLEPRHTSVGKDFKH